MKKKGPRLLGVSRVLPIAKGLVVQSGKECKLEQQEDTDGIGSVGRAKAVCCLAATRWGARHGVKDTYLDCPWDTEDSVIQVERKQTIRNDEREETEERDENAQHPGK